MRNDTLFTFIIPTLNADKYLYRCLKSISCQTYKNYEVFIVDGGSNDKTQDIAQLFQGVMNIRVMKNPMIDAESGKKIGLNNAKGEVVILLDSDNEIVGKEWIRTAKGIFQKHSSVWGVESPWIVNNNDSLLNQYFTMLKIADPIARVFSSSPRCSKDYGDYDIIDLKKGDTPVTGANGFFWRKNIIKELLEKNSKFEEVNSVSLLIDAGHHQIARLKKFGIYHHYCNSLFGYIAKRRKIAKKFLDRKAAHQKTWVDRAGKGKFIFSIIYNASFVGPIVESTTNMIRTRNIAWAYHPIVSVLTVCVYGYYFIKRKLT